LLSIFAGCGDVPVTVDESQYQPKIVVDGYLIAQQSVEKIRILRNYPLGRKIELNQIVLSDANVTLTDLTSGVGYPLIFNPGVLAFCRPDLIIQFDRPYRLDVTAVIDNRELTTSSVTRVPAQGLKINVQESRLAPLKYREKGQDGTVSKFRIAFQRSPDIDSYISSIVAMDATKETFIEENSYGIKKQDLDENNSLNMLKYNGQWTQTEMGDGRSEVEVEWFNIWFYGRYRLILYAADGNFTDYFLTNHRVQDIDGNLWEPRFHFAGDGIGVFGAAVVDTVYFEVKR
jgi:hypothetical protein